MGRIVILRLNGNYKDGIQVAFEWGQDTKDGRLVEGTILSRLESNEDIPQLYQRWQESYFNQEERYRNPRLEWDESDIMISQEECENCASDLTTGINEWLNSTSNDFYRIRDRLNRELTRHDDIRVLIQTNNLELRRLPWHIWNFWDNNDSIEIGISPLESEKPLEQSPRNKVRILAIFGDSTGINLEPDKKILENLKNVELRHLLTPQRTELEKELLDEQGWDIIFFAGHSSSKENGQTGYLRINKLDSLESDELNDLLSTSKAIKKRLKLAIFNSCDGIGLANALSSLHIPQIIFMRERVPDEVAHEFLRFFIQEFSQGKSLQESVGVARAGLKYLEGRLEKRLPYATWLPVIFQNSITEPWTWPQPWLTPTKIIKWGLAATALAFIGFFGYKIAAEPSQIGDSITEGEEMLVSTPRLKERGVNLFAECKEPLRSYLTIWEQKTREKLQRCFLAKSNYQEAFNLLKESWLDQNKDPETLIFLNNALLEAKNIKYYTIAVAVPIRRNKDGVKDVALAQELLRGVAQAQTQFNLGFFDQETDSKVLSDFPPSFPKNSATKGIGLKVIIVDDANIKEEAKKRAKAISKRSEIKGVVGHFASDITVEVVDIYAQNNLVLVSPGSTTDELTEKPRKNFFRVVLNTTFYAEYLAQYLIDKGQKKAVGFYNPRSPFTSSLWQEFQQRFEAKGGKILRVGEFDLSKPNFSAEKAIEQLLLKEEKRKGEIAIVLIPDGQVSDAQKHARDMIEVNNGRNQIVGTSTIYSSKTLEIRELESFEQLVVFAHWHRNLNTDFSREGKDLWKGEINSRTALAYDGTRTLIEALERQEKPTRKGMQKILSAPNFEVDGVTGKIKFCPTNGDRINPPAVFVHAVPSNNKYGLEFVPIKEQIKISYQCEGSEAEILEIKALVGSSKLLFNSNQKLDALIEAIKAKKKLRQLGNADDDTKNQVELVLGQAVYGVQEYNRLSGHQGWIHGIAISADGNLIASASADQTIKLWNKNGQLLNTLTGHEDEVRGVAISPNGDYIASASADKTIKLWNIKDGKLLYTLKGHQDEVWDVAISPDGNYIASASKDGTVKLWNNKGELLNTLEGHSKSVDAVAISPDGNYIASASADQTIKLWDKNGQLLNTLEGHEDEVRGVAISPDGNWIASASQDKTVRLWDRDGKEKAILKGHSNPVYAVAISPDGDYIVSASADQTIKLWNKNGQELNTLKSHSHRVWHVAISPDGNDIVSASWDKTIRLWKTKSEFLTSLRGHQDVVIGVDFSPDGSFIASVSDDKTVKLWDTDSNLLNTLKGHTGEVYGVAISPNGNLIASASKDKTVRLWDRNGNLLKTLKGHQDAVWDVGISPNGNYIASASDDKTIKLWNTDGNLLKTLEGHQDRVRGVAISPDGNLIVSASKDKTVKLWDRNGNLLNTLEGHQDEVWDVAISPDGNLIASASADQTIKLWNTDGEWLNTLEGHSNIVKAVSISPDGNYIASASDDDTIKVWNKDGALLNTLNGDIGSVWSLDFSPDGNYIASAGEYNKVIQWNWEKIQNSDLLRAGCDLVSDYLKHNSQIKERGDERLCD